MTEPDLHEVRDDELLEAYRVLKEDPNASNVGIALAECGGVGIPAMPELLEIIEKELKSRGI